MILSHFVAVKSSKFKRTWGTPQSQIIKFLDNVNNRSKDIYKDVFCTSKDSFVPIQNVLEF